MKPPEFNSIPVPNGKIKGQLEELTRKEKRLKSDESKRKSELLKNFLTTAMELVSQPLSDRAQEVLIRESERFYMHTDLIAVQEGSPDNLLLKERALYLTFGDNKDGGSNSVYGFDL